MFLPSSSPTQGEVSFSNVMTVIKISLKSFTRTMVYISIILDINEIVNMFMHLNLAFLSPTLLMIMMTCMSKYVFYPVGFENVFRDIIYIH